MITGANTNVRYRGILFHVQTEDSGRANPHIITHVYHGGTILGSQKTTYADQLEADDLMAVVRRLIDAQHQAMVERLQTGELDEAIAQRLGDTAVDAGIESKPDTEPESPAPEAPPPPRPDAKVAERLAGPPQPSLARAEQAARGFGEGLGAQKPLDEVILEYLAEKARDRGNDRSDPSGRKTRSGG